MDKMTRNILLFTRAVQVICIVTLISGFGLIYAVLNEYLDASYLITAALCILDAPMLFLCVTVVGRSIRRKVKENEEKSVTS
jgi:hypothetical protein